MSVCKLCRKSSTKNPTTSFFRFPKDIERCEQWIKKCSLSSELEKYSSSNFHKLFRICDSHFDRSMIRFDGKKNRLMSRAEPVLFLIPQVEKKCGITEVDNSKHICRFCGEGYESLTDIFEISGLQIDLPAMLQHIPIRVEKTDTLSTKICVSCTHKLISCHNFITTCINTQLKLKAMQEMKTYYINGTGATEKDISYNCKNVALPPKVHQESYFSTNKYVDFSSSFSLQHDYSNLWMKNSKDEGEWNQGNIYRCHSCHKGFSTVDCLNAHKRAHLLNPDKNGTFLCEECGSSFRNRFLFCNHLRQHNGEKPYRCITCNRRFHRLFLLKQHKLIHKQKIFACDACHRTFNRKAVLAVHLKKSCGKTSTWTRNIRKSVMTKPDVKTISLASSNLQKGSNSNDFKSKKEFFPTSGFSCDSKMQSKGEHAKYLCSFCGKCFARSDTLQNHKRTHTGERPFACRTCDFKFKQKGDCRKHEQNHHPLVLL